MNSEYMHIDGVKEVCKLSEPTVNKYIKERDFPKPVRIGSRNWWYKKDVFDWLNEQMKAGMKE